MRIRMLPAAFVTRIFTLGAVIFRHGQHVVQILLFGRSLRSKMFTSSMEVGKTIKMDRLWVQGIRRRSTV